MEIERKFLVKKLPTDIEQYDYHDIEQAYLCTEPVVRIRRQDNDFFLTYKSSGLMSHEEYNLPLNEESYLHLLKKADGNIITKRRYLIPISENLTVELDIFEGVKKGLILAEVEFPTEEEALSFTAPDWLGEDVTFLPEYHNSTMSKERTG